MKYITNLLKKYLAKSLTKYLESDPVLPLQLNFGYENKTEIFKTYKRHI